MTEFLDRGDHRIAYNHIAGRSPCVVFCAGFNSNMQGNKALALEQFCRSRGQAFIRFDYLGHGASSGDFADGSISTWLADTLAVIDRIAEEEVVLVGSSMGGWLALNAALRRPQNIKALLLLACAADITNYYDERLTGLEPQSDERGRSYYSVPNNYDDQQPYRIYQHLIDDGRQHFLLHQEIALDIPVRLIHGVQDDVVPWQRSEQIMHKLKSKDVSLHLLKNGDHRISETRDIDLIKQTLETLLD